jgi:hypothetical protein
MKRFGSLSMHTLWMLALTAPFAGCEESVFPYKTDALYAVDPALISHREEAAWKLNLPTPCFLAMLPGGRAVAVGGRKGVILATNGVAQVSFSWTELPSATAVAADPDGRIYIGAGSRVGIADATGRLSTAGWDSLGDEARIAGMAASSNQLWVCDAGQRVVWRFDPEGRLLGRLPAPGAPRDQAFVVPSPAFPVVMDRDGTFWVANPGRSQVQHHAADGQLLGKWASAGMSVAHLSGCCNPAYLAMLPNGDLVTSEKRIARVKIYGPDGTFRGVVVPPLALPGEEGRPVAVDPAGRIWVLDGATVRVFGAIRGR